MDVIMAGIFICMGIVITCSIVLKIITDKIIRDYEIENNELRRRLRQWCNYSYEQNDKIKDLERRIKEMS